jgi:hypothetical protein
LHQALLSVFILTSGGARNAKVPIEIVIIYKVGSNTLEINKHIIKLLQNEEATSHALSAWNCVALAGTSTHHLEKVLADAHVVFVVCVLTNDRVHNCLEDVLLGKNTVHVLDKLEGFVHLVILQVVNHKVKASLRDHIK